MDLKQISVLRNTGKLGHYSQAIHFCIKCMYMSPFKIIHYFNTSFQFVTCQIQDSDPRLHHYQHELSESMPS